MSVVGQSYGSEGPRSPNSELQRDAMSLLLAEIRSLRVQLEKNIQTNNALRLKLEEQLGRPVTSPSQSPRRSQVTVVRQLNFSDGKTGDDTRSVSSSRGEQLKKFVENFNFFLPSKQIIRTIAIHVFVTAGSM